MVVCGACGDSVHLQTVLEGPLNISANAGMRKRPFPSSSAAAAICNAAASHRRVDQTLVAAASRSTLVAGACLTDVSQRWTRPP